VKSSSFEDPVSQICQRATRDVGHIMTHSDACHNIVDDANGTSDAELCIKIGRRDCLVMTLRCEKTETAAELLSPVKVGRLKAALKTYFQQLRRKECRGEVDVIKLSRRSSDATAEGHILCLVFLVGKR
jgi:hypothetical protein